MRKRKKEKKPAMIIRLARKLGWEPGRVMSEVLEWLEVIVVATALAVLIMSFVTVRMHVPTGSMIPTIDPKDSFFVDRITYYFRNPKPGDIVVFYHTEQVLVKRVEEGSLAQAAGVTPGERLVYINTDPVYTVPFIEDILSEWPTGTQLHISTAEGGRYTLGPKPAGASTLADLGIVIREKRMRYVKRLIAVGGQTVQIIDGDLYVDGEKLERGSRVEPLVEDQTRDLVGVLEHLLVRHGGADRRHDPLADTGDHRFLRGPADETVDVGAHRDLGDC